MPRKRLKSLVDIAKAGGIEPGEYLLRRLKTHIKARRHDQAEALAIELLPYVRPKMKTVEHTGEIDGKVTIVIGGTDGH